LTGFAGEDASVVPFRRNWNFTALW
jgi:hypothetical protein